MMTKRMVEIFFNILNKDGHSDAHKLSSFDIEGFAVLSSIATNERNYKELAASTYGGILYVNNLTHSNSFRNFIASKIISEHVVRSDLFESIVIFHTIQIGENDFRFVIEMDRRAVLRKN